MGPVATINEVDMRDEESQKELVEVEHQLGLEELENEPPEVDEVLANHQVTRQTKKRTVHWVDEIEEDDHGKDSSYIYEEPVDVLDVLVEDAAGYEDENSEPSSNGLEDDMDLDEVNIDPPCPVIKTKTQYGKQATSNVAAASASK